MVRLIGNVLVSGLVAILLSSCAAGVKVIDTYTIEKKREPLALADPKPLDLQDIDWIIITKYAGARLSIDGGELRIINDDEVLAVVEDPRDILPANIL